MTVEEARAVAAPARASGSGGKPPSTLQRVVAAVLRRSEGRDLLAPEVLQRVLGILYVAGASIGTASMVFPQPPHTNAGGLFAIYGVAYVVGAVLLIGRGRLPRWGAPAGPPPPTPPVPPAPAFPRAATRAYPASP